MKQRALNLSKVHFFIQKNYSDLGGTVLPAVLKSAGIGKVGTLASVGVNVTLSVSGNFIPSAFTDEH